MKWTAISGSREVTEQMRFDVIKAVDKLLSEGNGIVVGGALGVDSIVCLEAVNNIKNAEKLIVIIPTKLSTYEKHYFKRAEEGAITEKQATDLINLLKTVKALNEHSLIEMDYNEINRENYFDRNTEILKKVDNLIAFQLNDSPGTQDAINKAKKLGMDTKVYTYTT